MTHIYVDGRQKKDIIMLVRLHLTQKTVEMEPHE